MDNGDTISHTPGGPDSLGCFLLFAIGTFCLFAFGLPDPPNFFVFLISWVLEAVFFAIPFALFILSFIKLPPQSPKTVWIVLLIVLVTPLLIHFAHAIVSSVQEASYER